MMKKLVKTARMLKDDEGGAAFILITLALPMIFGMAAFSIDLGYTYYISSRLQNASDLAALAGGTKLVQGDKAAVESQALDYVKLNLPSNWDIYDDKGQLISGTGKSPIKITPNIEAKCSMKLDTAGLPCYAGPGKVEKINYVEVSLGATTPLFFASGLGFTDASLSSNAIVTADGSTMPPLNVAIILDSTGSMIDPKDKTTACGGVSMTKLDCAKQAALGLVGTLWPVVDRVAIYTYPGMSQGTGSSPDPAAKDENADKNVCGSGTPAVADYIKDTNPANYKVVDFIDDYRDKTSPPGPGVKVNSKIIQALGGSTQAAGHTSDCIGLQVGTISGQPYVAYDPKNQKATKGGLDDIVWTSFADPIDAAQADLAALNANLAPGETQRQNVIVILSDGDANAPDSAAAASFNANMNSGISNPADYFNVKPMIETDRRPNQCQAAIAAAQGATIDKTWVYSVAYNASTKTGSGGSCTLDTSKFSQVKYEYILYTKTYTNTYDSKTRKCSGWVAGTPQAGSRKTNTVAAPGPALGEGPTTFGTPPTKPCSSKNSPVKYTDTYEFVTSVTPTTDGTKYDRSACDTMRAIASSPDKFYSVDKAGSGGCVSEVNPTTTDLIAIFKRVAISMMTKRRAPRSAI